MKGDLRCPNFRCALDFILPRNFIDHIRVCTEGDACAAVINRKELPCCFCKRYVLLGRYCSHLASCHNKTMKVSIRDFDSSHPEIQTFVDYIKDPERFYYLCRLSLHKGEL